MQDMAFLKNFEMLTGVILRPMQGPLTHSQELEIDTLKNAADNLGKGAAERYENNLRFRIPVM